MKRIIWVLIILPLVSIPVYLYNFYEDGIKNPKETKLAILPYEKFPNEYSTLIAKNLKKLHSRILICGDSMKR